MKENCEECRQMHSQKNTAVNIGIADQKWIKWMQRGKRMGCHQRPERSFFLKGYQFPVCARCTGVWIASALACIAFVFWTLDWKYCMLMCAVMFLDWLVQWLGIRESTNIRRLITGLIGGFGFMTLQLYAYQRIIFWIAGKIN